MTSELLSSKTVIYEGQPSLRGIQPAATSIAGAIGITERGPVGYPVMVTSLEEYKEVFGDFTPNSDLALAVKGFFENGGAQLRVVRTVHFDDVSNPWSAVAKMATGSLNGDGVFVPASVLGTDATVFGLQDEDRIVISVVGDNPVDVEFRGAPAVVESNPISTFALNDGDTLTLKLEDGREQTITFHSSDFTDIGAATDTEIAAAINGQLSGGKTTMENNPI